MYRKMTDTTLVVTVVEDHGKLAVSTRVIEFDMESAANLKSVAGDQHIIGIGRPNRFCVCVNDDNRLDPGRHVIKVRKDPYGTGNTNILYVEKYVDTTAPIGVDTSHKEEELRAFGEIMKTLGTYSSMFIAHPEYAKLVKDYVQLHLDEAKK